MKWITRAALLGTACFVSSCGEKEQVQLAPDTGKPVVNYTTPGALWEGQEFTAWMSRAELQYLQENNPPDRFFAHVEGRDDSGRIEYRAVVKPFDSEKYDQWAVFWGINESELFDWELRLLRTGFARQDMQAFADPTGQPLYQIVWLKSKDSPEVTDRIPAVANHEDAVNHPITPPADEPEEAIVNAGAELAKVEPPAEETPAPADEALVVPVAPVVEAPAKPVKTTVYIVQPGDTLGKIAKRRGVSVSDIRSANQLKADMVRIGQKLSIPVKADRM